MLRHIDYAGSGQLLFGSNSAARSACAPKAYGYQENDFTEFGVKDPPRPEAASGQTKRACSSDLFGHARYRAIWPKIGTWRLKLDKSMIFLMSNILLIALGPLAIWLGWSK